LIEKVGFRTGTWKGPRFNGLVFYQISGKENFERWMSLIGSSNSVQETKYLIWKKHGFYTPKSSLKSRMEALNLNIDLQS
jgi:hypothetical protein